MVIFTLNGQCVVLLGTPHLIGQFTQSHVYTYTQW